MNHRRDELQLFDMDHVNGARFESVFRLRGFHQFLSALRDPQSRRRDIHSAAVSTNFRINNGDARLFASRRQKSAGFAHALECRAAEAEVGAGQESVNANQPRSPGEQFLLFLGQLAGPEAALVFEDVVVVAGPHVAEPPARIDQVASGDQVAADLEIDQMRLAVVADQDVRGFVGIDIHNPAPMQFLHQVPKAVKKTRRDWDVFAERLAVDEIVNESSVAPGAEQIRHVGQVAEPSIKVHLAPAEVAPDGAKRYGREIDHAAHLENDAMAGQIIVKAGGGPEVVFNRSDVAIGPTLNLERSRQFLPAQGAQRVDGGGLRPPGRQPSLIGDKGQDSHYIDQKSVFI